MYDATAPTVSSASPAIRSQRLVQRAGRLAPPARTRRAGLPTLRWSTTARRRGCLRQPHPPGQRRQRGRGSVGFDYDNTDPGVVVSLARDPIHNGWVQRAGRLRPPARRDERVDSARPRRSTAALTANPGSPSARPCTSRGERGVGARSFRTMLTRPTIVATVSPPANGNG